MIMHGPANVKVSCYCNSLLSPRRYSAIILLPYSWLARFSPYSSNRQISSLSTAIASVSTRFSCHEYGGSRFLRNVGTFI